MVKQPALIDRQGLRTPKGARLCRPADRLKDIPWLVPG